ncbi:MAG: hypothetical protein EON59_00730 [Alphaproteobacteria bacterium]|nr:MAG: hypothetical protein EON59_00730 [Alphaproteobacteria bacterium]
MQLSPNELERFHGLVAKRGPDDCWLWQGERNAQSYPRCKVGGKSRVATQVSWEIANGKPFPIGMLACHSCDNPPFVNPNHIWPGTHKDNCHDMIAKGRRTWGPERPTKCPQGHDLAATYSAGSATYRGCPECAQTATVFGPGAICRKCGHTRTDDYRECRRDGRNHYRCRICNHVASDRRKRAATVKLAA